MFLIACSAWILVPPYFSFRKGDQNLSNPSIWGEPPNGCIDLRFSYDTQIGNNPLTLYADFINVFNKRNVLEYQIIIRPEGNLAEDIPPSLRWGRPVIYYRPTYMLLFVPSVGLRMSF